MSTKVGRWFSRNWDTIATIALKVIKVIGLVAAAKRK